QLRPDGSVIDGGSGVKNYQREAVNNTAGDMPSVAVRDREGNEEDKAGDTEQQPKAVRQRIGDLFYGKVIKASSDHNRHRKSRSEAGRPFFDDTTLFPEYE